MGPCLSIAEVCLVRSKEVLFPLAGEWFRACVCTICLCKNSAAAPFCMNRWGPLSKLTCYFNLCWPLPVIWQRSLAKTMGEAVPERCEKTVTKWFSKRSFRCMLLGSLSNTVYACIRQLLALNKKKIKKGKHIWLFGRNWQSHSQEAKIPKNWEWKQADVCFPFMWIKQNNVLHCWLEYFHTEWLSRCEKATLIFLIKVLNCG